MNKNEQQLYKWNKIEKTNKVRTLLIAIFGVRFVMVGMEVIVPLVTSRVRDAEAKKKRGSEDNTKVIDWTSWQQTPK